MHIRTLLCSLALVAGPAAQSCTWGSFDGSRINYAGGVLTNGSAHVNMRNIIQGNGGTLAAPTSTLTAAYLATVDVFYTSLLSTSTGTLSAAEQNDLINFVNGGGTLIVTGDIFPLPAYESFTSPFGITGWTRIGSCASGGTPGDVLVAHQVTAGVNVFRYCTNGTFTYPANARLLGDDGAANNPFLAVMEPQTGFGPGRILVLGDHNMFADSYIGAGDNTVMATNIVRWACGCPSALWTNYGSGWPGTNGVPPLSSSGAPVLGTSIVVTLGNSTNAQASGLVLAGSSPTSFTTPFGGTLLVSPAISVPALVPANGLQLTFAVPNARGLCGAFVFVQGVMADAGASAGVSFSPGLQLVIGQ